MKGTLFMLGSLLLAPVLWAQPANANAIKAVVGGQIIITQWDVNREARLTRLDPALAQKKLEQDLRSSTFLLKKNLIYLTINFLLKKRKSQLKFVLIIYGLQIKTIKSLAQKLNGIRL